MPLPLFTWAFHCHFCHQFLHEGETMGTSTSDFSLLVLCPSNTHTPPPNKRRFFLNGSWIQQKDRLFSSLAHMPTTVTWGTQSLTWGREGGPEHYHLHLVIYSTIFPPILDKITEDRWKSFSNSLYVTQWVAKTWLGFCSPVSHVNISYYWYLTKSFRKPPIHKFGTYYSFQN